jgi:ABC-type branched-subunit amino acid transport system substrate-binding protein/small-conductance mechanosensitive channel
MSFFSFKAMNFIKKLIASLGLLPKRTLFLLLLSMTAILAMLVSALVHLVIENRTAAHPIKLAVIAPLSGSDEKIGRSIRQGAELFAHRFNQQRKLGEHPIQLLVLDEAAQPGQEAALARQAAAEGCIGVIGHASNASLQRAKEIYQTEKLPLLTLAAADEQRYPEDPWVFRTSFDTAFETRFLANYVRNVVGEKIVNIIHPAGPDGERLATLYDETMQRFGTKVLFKWPYETHASALNERVQEISKEINDQKLIGYLLVVGDAQDSAAIVAGLRANNVRNRIVGFKTLATQAFTAHLARFWKGDTSLGSVMSNTLLTTPLLFDTAGETAQQIRGAYIAAYGDTPDWLAMQTYDATQVLGKTLTSLALPEEEPVANQRQQLRERLLGMDKIEQTQEGTNGPIVLNPKRASMPSVMIGVYDGSDLISALTQLTPIDSEAIVNYLQEVIEGRALYVNDRFMYKTNVVYTGIKLNKLINLDVRSNTAELEFWLWFRWRGKVEPQEIVFTNALDEIALKKPEDEGQDGDMHYRLYRVRGKFLLNYTDSKRAYGNELVGIAFHHANLSRNNMMYVTDVLGMNLAHEKTLADNYQKRGILISESKQDDSSPFFSKIWSWFGGGSSKGDDPLTSILKEERVLTPVGGWAIENAWVSQQTVHRSGLGAPLFVGFGKQRPSFSQVDHGILLKPDAVRLRDFVPAGAFLYLTIFSFMLAMLAEILDAQPGRGQFWRAQTLGLRLISWPLLLVSLGNLTLDYSLTNWPVQTTQTVQMVYSGLWWLISARLLAILTQRFLWEPLELKAKRKVPDSVKSLTSFTIYLFAIFGITAFVFGQAITSLLATTGMTAMIIGLAVKANIDNVFSGIVLNIERPFNIGDAIIYDKVSGKVVDITWRTTQVCGDNGCIISIPNSKISGGQLYNFTRAAYAKTSVAIDVAPHYDPQQILSIITSCLPDNPHFLPVKSGQEPKVFFRGIRYETVWTARFEVTIFTADPKDTLKKATQLLWQRLWQRFSEEGIAWQHEALPEVTQDTEALKRSA